MPVAPATARKFARTTWCAPPGKFSGARRRFAFAARPWPLECRLAFSDSKKFKTTKAGCGWTRIKYEPEFRKGISALAECGRPGRSNVEWTGGWKIFHGLKKPKLLRPRTGALRGSLIRPATGGYFGVRDELIGRVGSLLAIHRSSLPAAHPNANFGAHGVTRPTFN